MTSFRGKGVSRDKFLKGTSIPKHAGNFSASTIHYQSLQSKDYHVKRINGELIIGDHTPLAKIFPEQLVWLATNDPNFKSYMQIGEHTHNNKKHEAHRILSKLGDFNFRIYLNYEFIYREEIFTDGDFEYQFPNY